MCRLVLVLGAVAVGFAAVPVAVAQAATYAVWSCADALGKALPAGDWSPSTVGAQMLATTTCGTNATGQRAGSLQALSGAGPGQSDMTLNAAWNVAAPANTKISDLEVWWTNSAGVQAPGRVQIYAGAASIYARDSGSFGNLSTPLDGANHQTFTGLSANTAALVAWCVSACARPDRAIASTFSAYRVKVTVSDDSPPTGQASGLTQGMTIAGPVALRAQASDNASGVRDLALIVDGRVVDARSTGGQCQDISPTTGDANEYAVMRPCAARLPAGDAATFTLTPALLGQAGAHSVAVIARDAAANTATLLNSTVIVAPATLDGSVPASRYDPGRDLFFNPDADLSAPARPNGSNASSEVRLGLAFVTKHARRVNGHRRVGTTFTRRRTVAYTSAARLRARLTTLSGAPIAGARLYRAISIAGDPWTLSAKPIVTSTTGRASILMPGRAPSRRVKLVYFPTTHSNTSKRSPEALMAVRAPVSLQFARRVVPRGDRFSLTARLRAGRREHTSVLGTLQIRQRRGWRTIRQLHFNAAPGGRGTARIALRLRTPATYRFRALVPAQASLRYTRGVSTTRVLHVTP